MGRSCQRKERGVGGGLEFPVFESPVAWLDLSNLLRLVNSRLAVSWDPERSARHRRDHPIISPVLSREIQEFDLNQFLTSRYQISSVHPLHMSALLDGLNSDRHAWQQGEKGRKQRERGQRLADNPPSTYDLF